MTNLQDIDVHLVQDVNTAMTCKRWLSTRQWIALDTETTGIDMSTDVVRTVQLGDEDTAYVIPLEGVMPAGTPKVNMYGWGGFAIEVLTRYQGEFVAHNATFDHTMLKRTLGVDLPRHRIHDTRLMSHVLDSVGSLKLKSIAKKIVDPLADMGQDILENAMQTSKWNWSTIPISFTPYWWYGGLDTVLTARVRNILLPQVMHEAPRSYELELAVSWVCNDMALRGVQVDRPYTAEFASSLSTYITNTEAWCMSTYGISPGSSDNVIKILRADGVDLIKRTKSGAKYSIDKEVLQAVNHPLADAVLGRRQAQKLIGYLASYLELSERDGLIHPSINTVGGTAKTPYEPGGSSGVRTGRMSMSSPNLQNVPTRTKEGARVRRCFIPRDGRSWVKCDADQIEARILAHMCDDPAMIATFGEEGDFFVNMSRQLFHDPDFQRSDPRRQFVKNGVYAKVYGAGLERFAETAHATVAEASAFMSAFDVTFSGVRRWIKSVERLAASRLSIEGTAYVRSPLTGRRHVADNSRMYALVNYLIQGTAGEILKLALVKADQAGLSQFMLFPVHDEIDLDVPTADLPDVLATLHDVTNDDTLLKVPITWSSDVGPNWGECK